MGSHVKTKRKPNWTDSEVKILLHIWKDNLQKLSTNKRKQHLFDDMSKQMELYGIFRDAMEIKIKILNLKKKFREQKVQELNTGTVSQWRFYSQINEILGDHINLDGHLKDTSTRCEEKPVNQIAAAESGPVTILRFAQKVENEDVELYYNEDDTEVDSDDIGLEGNEYNEPSSNSCNASESNRERKEPKSKFIEELYEEYKETKQSLADTDKKLLELLSNQNDLIKTQNELCRTQNSLLSSLLEKMN